MTITIGAAVIYYEYIRPVGDDRGMVAREQHVNGYKNQGNASCMCGRQRQPSKVENGAVWVRGLMAYQPQFPRTFP